MLVGADEVAVARSELARSPRRRRKDKRHHHHELTMARALALRIGPMPVMPEVDTSAEDAELEAVYWANRDELLAGSSPPDDMPWGWWAFEAGVVDPRGERPRLRPVA
jgi:hypothetical protein